MTQSPDTLKNRKREMRKSASLLRARLAERDGISAANSLVGFAETFNLDAPDVVVSGYMPIGSEIDCRTLLDQFHQRGFTLGLPLVTAASTPLTFLRYCPGDTLVKGNFDVLTPEHDVERVSPTILLIPLLAFDDKGYRLGYGGGFYDRTLALLRQQNTIKAIGLAFSGQEVNAVPHDELDQPLDCVLCENGLIEF